MKLKDWLKRLLAGASIGVGSAIPGVSGGTVAVILGIYEKMVYYISNIFKKFKEALIYLFPILIGVILAIIPTIYLMHKALNGFVFGIVSLFAGFIIGSFPGVKDEVKGKPVKKAYIIALIIAALLALGLGIGSVFAKADVYNQLANPSWWMYLVLIPVGLIASIALVVPGISGSMLLLLLGFYKPLIDTTVETVKQCLTQNDWSHLGIQFGLLACFAIGVIIGFYFVSKLMHFLLEKYHDITFYAIIGFIIGSTIALFFNYDIYYGAYDLWAKGTYISIPMYIEIPIGIVLLIVGCILSYLLVRMKRKSTQDEVKEKDSEE